MKPSSPTRPWTGRAGRRAPSKGAHRPPPALAASADGNVGSGGGARLAEPGAATYHDPDRSRDTVAVTADPAHRPDDEETDMAEHANPEGLGSTQWVTDHLDHPTVRILEVDHDPEADSVGAPVERS
jgi:hypothetical protein